MKTVKYVTTHELGKVADNWIKNNPHNNNYAIEWEVIEPNESAYPEMENYFLDNGLKIGDKVIVHSFW